MRERLRIPFTGPIWRKIGPTLAARLKIVQRALECENRPIAGATTRGNETALDHLGRHPRLDRDLLAAGLAGRGGISIAMGVMCADQQRTSAGGRSTYTRSHDL